MDTILNQFDSNEAMLLMYLANELNAHSRTIVEQRLKEDASLRQELESIRASYALFDSTITTADQTITLPSAFSSARQFGDAVREKFKNRPSKDDSDSINWKRINWVLIPAAVAASLVIGMYTWFRLAASAERGDDAPTMNLAIDDEYRGKWFDLRIAGRAVRDDDLTNLNDEQIEQMSESLVYDSGLHSEGDLDAIKYMSKNLKDRIQ